MERFCYAQCEEPLGFLRDDGSRLDSENFGIREVHALICPNVATVADAHPKDDMNARLSNRSLMSAFKGKVAFF